MTYAVVSTVSPPSAIHHSIKCQFVSPSEPNLILVKTNIIEIYQLTEFGINSIFKINLYGRIVSLQKYQPKDQSLDHLIILTEKNQLFSLRFDPDTNQVLTNSKLNLFSPYGRPNPNKSFCLVDPIHQLCLVSVYQGELGLIWFDDTLNNEKSSGKPSSSGTSQNAPTFSPGEITSRQRLSIEQLNILDICFLNQMKYPTIALLYSDYSGSLWIKFYQLNPKSNKLTEVFGEREVDGHTTKLIPMPQGGLIILGGTRISAYNQKYSNDDQLCVNLVGDHEFTSFDIIDKTRYLVGDGKGKLHVINLSHSKTIANRFSHIHLHRVGFISTPQTVNYLGNRFVFIGSLGGDSQIWRLPYQLEPFKLFQTLTNLGPITDLKYLPLKTKGPAALACTSGIGKDGSVRLITSGASWDRKLHVPVHGVLKIFAFQKLRIVAMVFANDIKLLKWRAKTQEIEPFDSGTSIYNGNPTLLMIEIQADGIIQVTNSEILLYSAQNKSIDLSNTWSHPTGGKIIMASGDRSRVLIVDDSNTLFYFKIISNQLELITEHKFDRPISFIELLDDSEFKNYCIISNWNRSNVSLFNIKHSTVVSTIELPEIDHYSSLITSIKVAHFNPLNYLFIGLSDGNCFYSRISTKKLNEFEFQSLGLGPIHFDTIVHDSKEHLIATGNRPTMIHYHLEKVVFTPIHAPDASYIASFPETNWTILLNDEGWEVGEVIVESSLQIQSHFIGKQPRKIIFLRHLNKLVLMTHRTNDQSVGSIQLVDPDTFDSVSEHTFDEDEMTSCIHWIEFGQNSDQHYLVVGTGISEKGEEECYKGKIHLFQIDDTLQINLVFSIPVQGAVYDLTLHKNKLIVGINGMLTLFQIDPSEKSHKQLHTLYMPTIVTQLDIVEDLILVQDYIRSVQVVTLTNGEDQLIHQCGDNTPTWPISSRALDTSTILSGDSNFNLVLMKRSQMALARGEKPKVVWAGQIHWGDQVNCITRKPNDPNTLVFGTSGGAIGVIRIIDGETYEILNRLVANLSHSLQGVGGLEYDLWRQFENERKQRDSSGFIDGDMLDIFLNLDSEAKKKVIRGEDSESLNLPLNMAVELVKEILTFY